MEHTIKNGKWKLLELFSAPLVDIKVRTYCVTKTILQCLCMSAHIITQIERFDFTKISQFTIYTYCPSIQTSVVFGYYSVIRNHPDNLYLPGGTMGTGVSKITRFNALTFLRLERTGNFEGVILSSSKLENRDNPSVKF